MQIETRFVNFMFFRIPKKMLFYNEKKLSGNSFYRMVINYETTKIENY